jgi:23S rRNA (pseudouridine1915-N3)-methyltransferase
VPRLHVVASSAKLPDWAEAACAQYARRMPKGYEVARVSAKADRVLAAVPRGSRLVVLDERGTDFTTPEFSRLLGEQTAFLVGGPDGLDEKVRRAASLMLRLSALTLPHALAQVILHEQLYRAATLLIGHPYHRE